MHDKTTEEIYLPPLGEIRVNTHILDCWEESLNYEHFAIFLTKLVDKKVARTEVFCATEVNAHGVVEAASWIPGEKTFCGRFKVCQEENRILLDEVNFPLSQDDISRCSFPIDCFPMLVQLGPRHYVLDLIRHLDYDLHIQEVKRTLCS